MSNPSSQMLGRYGAPRNQWYVAAMSSEVTNAKPLARMLLGEEIVLYRTESGAPVALANRCPHRAVALSNGKVCGNELQCFYHGLRFGADGHCKEIPSQANIPAKMRVHSYPVIENACFVWVWVGDPEKADPSLMVDLSDFQVGPGADPEARVLEVLEMEIDGNYLLLHENLLDVSHISFLHEGTFDSGAICKAQPRIETPGKYHILIEREVEETLNGAYAAAFELHEGMRVRRLLRSQSWAPAFNVVSNFFWDLDKPDAPVLYHHSLFAITPRDDHSTHYFAGLVKNWGIDFFPPEMVQFVRDVFDTDKAAIESQQRSYDLLGAAAPDTSVAADAAAVRFRRITGELLADTANQPEPIALNEGAN